MWKRALVCVLFLAGALEIPANCQLLAPEFISLDSAKAVVQGLEGSLPPELKAVGPQLNSKAWSEWVQNADTRVRRRLDQGEEDTLSNLLRFGVTYTKEYRVDDEYFARYGDSTLVNSFAEHRADDLIRALAAPNGNQGMIEMRAFVEKQGYSLNTPAERKKLKKYLLDNLARMQKEFLQAREQAKLNRSQMFEKRGISLDTNLWPDYDLDAHLRRMIEKGMLKPGSIRRVAIVGPGLDFVNKREGVDFYPPQTTQPFAVLDSLLRLGLANPETVELYTLDISSRVNVHLKHARKKAVQGQPYTVQLAWYANGRYTDEFRAKFVEYWQKLGAQIGEPVAPIPVPEAAAGTMSRAVRIRPAVVKMIKPIDMNIVYQYMPTPAEQRFDLIIGTNIFLYYGAFEQSLARVNIAAMLKPGGYLLSNDKLQDTVASGLESVLVTEIPMTGVPVITDYIFCYRRSK